MSDQLQQAKQALLTGGSEEAQVLAAEALKQNPNNPEAWFVLSEAVSGERKLIFLRKAVALDPSYTEAKARLAEIEGEPAEPTPAATIAEEPVVEESEYDSSTDSYNALDEASSEQEVDINEEPEELIEEAGSTLELVEEDDDDFIFDMADDESIDDSSTDEPEPTQVAAVTPSTQLMADTEATAQPSMSSTEEMAEGTSSSGGGLDFDLILLAFLGILFVVVAYLLIRSLFGI